MASSKKKRAETEIEENNEMIDDDPVSDGGGSDEELMDQEMEVEFEARIPQDSDFHGIKTLLKQLFLKANINLSELANTIISQNYVGNVIKQLNDVDDDSEDDFDDGDPVFGVMSVINLTERKKDLECVKEIISYLVDKCRTSNLGEDGNKIIDIVNSEDVQVGFLISERFLNIPIEIAAPSYESLRKDMMKAVNKKMKYDFGYYILISKSYRAKMEASGDGGNKLGNQLFYSNPEDEILSELSDIKVSYSVAADRDDVVSGSWDDEDSMEAMRTVMVFTADKYDSIIQTLKTQLGQT
ncbi:protein BCCIP homolog [Patella vulgata]|uniref:protein BCCIP homolog n=1 Tax=Patella vulgata TaxID=6465 RepID=UPI00217FBD08|nr:protein BCCIP homolog [Patella vulgata]